MTLAEVTISVAIAAIAIGGTLTAFIFAVRALAPDARDAAMQQAADRELRIARDILKYEGSSLVPAAVQTSVPIPNASPLPVLLSLTVSGAGRDQDGSMSPRTGGAKAATAARTVTITAKEMGGPRVASAQAVIATRAPQPGETFTAPQSAAAPTGAP